jgi:hypothetical protein
MELPLVAYALPDMLAVTKTNGKFADRYTDVSVFEVAGGRNNFSAFVYMCRLNLDLDGSATTYGYDNAANPTQKHLSPLETWTPSKKVVQLRAKQGKAAYTHAEKEKVGLGNACGDPGDKSKGWKNFLAGNRNFYWAGLKALTKGELEAQNRGRPEKLKLIIDDRAELEAGLGEPAKDGKPKLKAEGSGYFPVINPNTGYYISGTSVAADGQASTYSADHYLDSSAVPYAVWANNWSNINLGGRKLHLGDFGLAINNNTGASTGYVYGDSGTQNKVGESSQKLHEVLGGAGLVTFLAFPGSGSGKVIKGRYHADPLGTHPEFIVRVKVLMNLLKLHASASNLALRLSMGPELAAPKGHGSASAEQARLYKNFMSAFSHWTFAS